MSVVKYAFWSVLFTLKALLSKNVHPLLSLFIAMLFMSEFPFEASLHHICMFASVACHEAFALLFMSGLWESFCIWKLFNKMLFPVPLLSVAFACAK